MSWETINPRQLVTEEIAAGGGWVNSHTHIDRSYIINAANWGKTADPLHVKWDHPDEFKARASVGDIVGHMSQVIENQLAQGVQALGSFIDCDSVVRDKNLRAAEKLKERYGRDIRLKFMNQPIKGLMDPVERAWFEEAADYVDIIGGLPERDSGAHHETDHSAEHLDIIFDIARARGKALHIHGDQLNQPSQRDTEQVIAKTIEYDYQGNVSLVHCISLAAQAKAYRQAVYDQLREQDISVISCPTAWIDCRRNETLAPTHNAITPVDEMLAAGVRVALGTDDIADIYKPFNDGDMWTELRFLLEANHLYDIAALARIATVNGLHVLGLEAGAAIEAVPGGELDAAAETPVRGLARKAG